MRFLERGGRSLAGEARRLLAGLRDRRLALLLGFLALLLLLAAQAPLRYAIQVGQADGPGADLPLLSSFYPPEHDIHGTFRWTSARAIIRLPGVGRRALRVALTVFPVNQEVAQRGPREIEVWDGEVQVLRLPVRPAGAIYRFILPATPSGDQIVELRSATFIPTGDQRSIGSPVDALSINAAGGPLLPAWRSLLGWLAAAALAWLALRRAGFESRGALALLLPIALLAGLAALLDPPRLALGVAPGLIALALGWLLVLLLSADVAGLLLAGAALATIAGGLWALGAVGAVAQPDTGVAPQVIASSVAAALLLAGAALATIAGGLWALGLVGAVAQPDTSIAPQVIASSVAAALLLAGWLRPPAAALLRRFGGAIAPGAWRWLALLALLVFALRYGGKIYPDSMPGDIGFHANRYDALVRGSVLQLSLNRGVYFPYPPALYLLLAPFALLGLPQRVLLQLGGALLDALSPLLVYTIARRTARPSAPPVRRVWFDPALAAAAIYALSAAGFMTTWWNFSTHIFAQFAHLLLMTALVLLWPARTKNKEQRTKNKEQRDHRSLTNESLSHADPAAPFSILHSPFSILAVLLVLQSLVYLGHFGFWINTTLLGVSALAVALIGAWRGRAAWSAFRLGLLSFVAAELLAALLFYSNYAGLFLEQIRATLTGGLTGLANRAPVDRAVLWQTLWDAGLSAHFGFFPVPLAVIGLLLIWSRTENREPRTEEQRFSILNSQFSILILMSATFAIGAVFAVLPFVSGSTLSTRWLMFSAWAVALGAALSVRALWRRGWVGRLLVLCMGGYVVWITTSMWLMALAWRVRPPEPF